MKPCSPAANSQTALWLQRFYDAPRQNPPAVMSGAFRPHEAQRIFAACGEWPTIIGVEYCTGFGIHPAADANAAIDWKKQNAELYAHGAAGGIVRILTHFPNPCNAQFGGLRDKNADIQAILTPDHPARQRWLGLLDAVAAGLKDLDDHGITALLGPLHEMNCNGFWWGVSCTNGSAALYRALWRDMFQHLNTVHACANVLWVCAPLGHDPFDPAIYPGDDVVDITGLDVYSGTLAPFVDAYQQVKAFGKPVILSEFGPLAYNCPADNRPVYDCRTLPNELMRYWPGVSSFMFWGEEFAAASHAHVGEMMADQRVIARGYAWDGVLA